VSINATTGELTLNNEGESIIKVTQSASSDGSIWSGVSYAKVIVAASTTGMNEKATTIPDISIHQNGNFISIKSTETIEQIQVINTLGQTELYTHSEFYSSLRGMVVISIVTNGQTISRKIVLE
jgi:hypothetical protein